MDEGSFCVSRSFVGQTNSQRSVDSYSNKFFSDDSPNIKQKDWKKIPRASFLKQSELTKYVAFWTSIQMSSSLQKQPKIKTMKVTMAKVFIKYLGT